MKMKLNLFILPLILSSCCINKKNIKILEIEGNAYLCTQIPNLIEYTSPAGKNPITGKKVIVLNREFLECRKIKTDPSEMMLKTTYLGAIKNHN